MNDDGPWADLLREVDDPRAAAVAFENAPLACGLYEGPDLRVAAVNRAYRESVGRRLPIGVPLLEAMPELAGQEIVEALRRVHETGEPYTVQEWRLMVDVGSELRERYYNARVIPIRDHTGAVRRVASFTEDVTELVTARRAAETEAAQAEQRYLAAQEVVLTLQRNLLPASVPVLPGVRLAAQYVVAAAELQAGGDWFDAVPVGGGRVALVVGDVVGHGAAAAAAMAQLRPVLREALRSGASPAAAVDRLDAHAADIAATRAATVCLAVLDPADGTLTHVSRAHPAPLVCAPDGATRYLRDGRTGPLGVGAGPSRPAVTRLEPDEVVLLYSDGLVERPGEAADAGAERLARIAASAVRTDGGDTLPEHAPDRLCALAVERVTRAGYADDVTVLAAQRSAVPVAPLVLDLPADAGALPQVRDAVAAWLADLDVGRDDQLAVPLVAWEAASNVVDHAYRGREPGRLRCTATLDAGGVLRLEVADDGTWWERTAAAAAAAGGRGLGLIRTLSDEVDLRRGAVENTAGNTAGTTAGTTVVARRRLGHPAVIGTTAEVAVPSVTRPLDVAVVRRDPTVLRVRGPVDAGTAGLLRTAVLRHGGEPLVLDLAPVTFLASAGVQLLFDLAQDERIRLSAPAGSPAHHVLDLTGLSTLLTAAR